MKSLILIWIRSHVYSESQTVIKWCFFQFRWKNISYFAHLALIHIWTDSIDPHLDRLYRSTFGHIFVKSLPNGCQIVGKTEIHVLNTYFLQVFDAIPQRKDYKAWGAVLQRISCAYVYITIHPNKGTQYLLNCTA